VRENTHKIERKRGRKKPCGRSRKDDTKIGNTEVGY
jgi:hypothetical protein